MKIYICVKAAGKRKAVIDKVPYELSENITTLRDFLTELVHIEVERYNQKGTDVQIIPYLYYYHNLPAKKVRRTRVKQSSGFSVTGVSRVSTSV